MSKFLKGTIILLVAGLVTRILGFINRIVLARLIGEEGVGLYMMVFPTLMLVIAITQLGLPVAISRSVAEAEAKGDFKKIKKILVVSLATTVSLSLIFTPALFFSAPYLSDILFTDDRTKWPLLAITPIIPIVAVSAVIRGYFQGRQNMKPAAYSQVIEQIVRIALIAVFTKMFLPYGIEYAAAGAMLAAVIGELLSMIYLFTAFKMKKKFRVRKKFFSQIKAGKSTFRELMGVSIPTLGSRLIGNLSWFFEPIVVSLSLAIAGIGTALATKQYGSLTGFAMPLLALPSFITYSLSTSLVPAISEAHSKQDKGLIEYRLQQALRFVFLTGGLAIVIMYVLAEPLMEAMYGSASGFFFIKIMAPFYLLYYYQGPLQATLQALDLARAAMINSLVGSVVKLAVIFALASQPSFGINGVALGIIVGIVLVTFLHFATVMKKISFTFYIREYLLAFIVMGLSGWAGALTYQNLLGEMSPVMKLVMATIVISFAYCSLLLAFGLIRKNDLERIPIIGQALSRFAFR
ncbi:stage V sporulation protein B [Robertmurraya yapensis]|uniref:Stage V sporulation protein B n=1 Tax=Bacillus yapensis TaxID=2492960 RepID=A0A3S0KPN7_9BACI|nr:stage V sporulation protein B [Bacillus yapensis]RTR35435.1 stage V sporulation protein B [Bacillus yapensis]TKS97944.1 stage V sporulation protein B [Bacillus yapensis]